MKSPSRIAAIVVLVVVIAHAGINKLPEIPNARFTVTEAIKKMETYWEAHGQKRDSEMVLVAVEWCRADQFQPRLSDGTQWHLIEGEKEWSWIFTYAVRGKNPKTFSGIRVMRIRDNGEIDGLIGTRT